ncbi:alpha/beta-hydrolase [Sarocladium strictum]
MAQLQQVNNFGDTFNTQLSMKIYVPPNPAPSPAIVLALHPCGGSGDGYFGQTSGSYVPIADSIGAILIYPSSPKDFNCWDVHTSQSNTHDGGGDTQVLVNMVDYVISTYNGDPARVFVTGSSSGCMMTNLISAVYPDVFAAASCYSGMPAGCLNAIGSGGSSPISADPACANGQVNKSGEEWAAIVHNMYPGYTGDYPRMLTWHGTADNLIFIPNLDEQLKEWSTLLGVSFTEDRQNTPEGGYTWKVYGDGTKLVGVSAQGVGHTVPVHGQQDFEWFGLL